mmetsp:Transcript_11470/g.15876  ORF Transcript_11470/g.15876 Transcript_11470/m.15876 type:complete len:246 (-) Transcript_11470:131-868(-)
MLFIVMMMFGTKIIAVKRFLVSNINTPPPKHIDSIFATAIAFAIIGGVVSTAGILWTGEERYVAIFYFLLAFSLLILTPFMGYATLLYRYELKKHTSQMKLQFITASIDSGASDQTAETQLRIGEPHSEKKLTSASPRSTGRKLNSQRHLAWIRKLEKDSRDTMFLGALWIFIATAGIIIGLFAGIDRSRSGRRYSDGFDNRFSDGNSLDPFTYSSTLLGTLFFGHGLYWSGGPWSCLNTCTSSK